MENEDSSGSSSPERIWAEEEGQDAAASLTHKLLRFSSPQFQPRLALKMEKEHMIKLLPDPTAPMYLNLHHYDKAVAAASKKDEDDPPPPLPKAESLLKYPITGRRFLPHQMPVYNPRVEAPNTIKVMQIIQGPLSALRVAMNERKRVKVWTRRDTGMRGFLVGFIEAFDKHWNLALRDVDEVFYRKRRDKVTPNFGHELIQPTPSPSKSPTKRSKRIAAMSKKSKPDGTVMMSGCSKDLLQYCRSDFQKLSLDDNNKKDLYSKSFARKHGVRWVNIRTKDEFGFVIVGVTDKVEIVERHVGQLFVMGNDIVIVETMKDVPKSNRKTEQGK